MKIIHDVLLGALVVLSTLDIIRHYKSGEIKSISDMHEFEIEYSSGYV